MKLDCSDISRLVPRDESGHHLPTQSQTSVFQIGTNPLHVAGAAVRIHRRREPLGDGPCRGSNETTGN